MLSFLSLLSTLDCEMSHRSLEEQLEELLSLSELCPVYFRQPTVACFFSNGVFSQMAEQIESMGVKVFGYIKVRFRLVLCMLT